MNPFSKYKPRSSSKASVSDVESGQGGSSPLAKINTDDMSSGAQARRQDLRGASPHAPTHAQTLPNVTSDPNRTQNTGETIPRSASPIQEEQADDIAGRGRTETEKQTPSSQTARDSDESRSEEHHEKHGLSEKFHDLTHRKSKADSDSDHKKDHSDDDNGKNKQHKKFTAMSQVRATILNSWINVLLIACKTNFYTGVFMI